MTYRRRFAPIYELAVAPATYATGASLQRQAAIFSLSAAAFPLRFFFCTSGSRFFLTHPLQLPRPHHHLPGFDSLSFNIQYP